MDDPETRTVKFRCIRCNKCGELPIIGARWKCDVCHGYDLCTVCYLGSKHNPGHSFVRFDAPECEGIKVASKQGSQKKQCGDVLTGANADGDITKVVVFKTIYCDACGQREILGTRWKCAVCFNYDLCTSCHRTGKHSLDHVFLRIDVPGGTAFKVPPRQGAVKAEALKFQGIYCDSCEQHPITGTRWKCALCIAYDLCTACYMGGEHNLGHMFLRVDLPGGNAEMVASRKGSSCLPLEDIQDKDVTFCGISCAGCDKHEIVGARWKCDQCIGYDLCTFCYMVNTHNVDHIFWRFDSPGREGLTVLPRKGLVIADSREVLQEGQTPRDGTARDHSARDELVTKLQELQDAVQCAICMEGRRNVAFLCGHSACADCAANLTVCHMCRLTITKRITLY